MPERKKLLVLAVDIDNDLGKAGLQTPILGRREVLDTAVRFALYDPEDSDANVLFAAVKLADELRRQGYEAEPAVVAGSELGGVEATLIARSQLEELVSKYNPDGIVLVSDGSEDELLLHMISSIRPVYGVHRVVVKQHRGVEETYVLLARYIRKAFTEPRFSRLFLGVPGVILVVFSMLALMNMLRQALLIGLMIAGLAMVVRGFDIEDKIVHALTETPVTLVAYVVAGISAAIAVGLTAAQLHASEQLTPHDMASLVRGVTALLGFSASIAILGHAASKFISGSIRLAREITAIAVIIAAVALADSIADALEATETVTLTEFIASLVRVNFHMYAIGSVVAVAVTWRLAKSLEKAIARTYAPSSGKSGEHEEAQTRQTRATSAE
ncbi:DUF373 family protein [Hyperthermus butylicus]|uniref:DUF373 family protein n=1 Tax=Hyperthermus butylicus (strain DSM 5456 / JCM 9403 / PLM1-5) TaxID=415426 RepID=A2BLS0_HYPBU|nr:DUF373 family protein [Hyperthermus butylicus]ABM80931.1 hypothetical protein Hbut_1088 [Hyperthermus butylicus DSM 5456]